MYDYTDIVTPTVFNECFTVPKQIAYLEEHKQDKLTAGTNITIVDNEISSTAVTPAQLEDGLETKQDKLTAGTNITIVDNVISSTGGGVTEQQLEDALDTKQNVLTFDNNPAQGSTNPVTSNGIFQYVNGMIDESYVEIENVGITAQYGGVAGVNIPVHLYVKYENSRYANVPYGTNGAYGSNSFNKKEMFLIADLSVLPDNTSLQDSFQITFQNVMTWKFDEVFGGMANLYINAYGGYIFKKSAQYQRGTIIRPNNKGFVVTDTLALGTEQSQYLLYMAGDVLYTPHVI